MPLAKSLSVLVGALLVSQSAFAILPPWWGYQRLLTATVGASPCVRVGEPQPPAGESRAYTVAVQGCSDEVAHALKAVLAPEAGTYLVVKVLDRAGTEVADVPPASSLDDLKQRFQVALGNNEYLSAVTDRRAMRGEFSVEFKPVVIRVHNDNISDPYRNSNYSAQDAFTKVLRTQFPGPHYVAFTTSP